MGIVTDLDVNKLRMMKLIRRHWRGYSFEGPDPFGPSGLVVTFISPGSGVHCGSIIVSQAAHDGAEWIHASIAWPNSTPTYDDLLSLKAAVFGPDREAYQVFPPASEHISIHDHALHLWGRADGRGVLPRFGAEGSI